MDDEMEVVDIDIVKETIVDEEDIDDELLDDDIADDPEDDGEEKSVSAPRRAAILKTGKTYRIEDFEEGSYVVYPTHGVGLVDGVEELTVAGQKMSLIKITFTHDRLSVRLPLQKINDMGLRPVSSENEFKPAMDALSKKKRVGRKMWSRRAQEYEAKINSGDPTAVAEVVRDLFRRSGAAEQSFSERQLYKAALDRFSRELAAVRTIDEDAAIKQVEDILEVAAA